MPSIRRRHRASTAVALVVLAAALGGLALAAEAGASGTLLVSPSTGLTNGQSVTVSGSGFTASSTGGVLECNNDTSQPTVQVAGNNVPVSCTNPLLHLKTTSSSGDLASFSFTVATGTVGPPTTGTDSSGGDAATDAANYPCPPTTAQVSAGDSCLIAFGDQAGDQAQFDISFSGGGGGGTTTTTTGSSTTTTTTAPTTTTTTAQTSTTTTVPCNAQSKTSSGSPSITANPGTCLNGGTKVTVTGSGFTKGATGAVLECNNDRSQPTVDLPAPISQAVPVSCSGISAAGLVTVGSGGSISTTFSIISPTSGPPCGGSDLVTCPATDSAGKAPATDATSYPCPPTAAQIAAGDSCVLAFGDSSSSDPQTTVAISFVPAPTPSSGSQSSGSSVSQGSSAGTTSASPATGSGTTGSSANGGTLAFTGSGPGVWALAVGGIILIDLGFLVVTIYYRPRELFAMARRRANRAFGFPPPS
jgi:hypothetical protein